MAHALGKPGGGKICRKKLPQDWTKALFVREFPGLEGSACGYARMEASEWNGEYFFSFGRNGEVLFLLLKYQN